MVSRKRLYYGFNGHHVPAVPRAPRSVRRRVPLKNPVEDHQICAFELLADVAGKLLRETESSASSNASHPKDLLGIHLDSTKKEQVEENNKASRSDCLDQGSCVESVFIPELPAEELDFQPTLQDTPVAKNDSFALQPSNFTRPANSKKVDCELKLGMCSAEIGAENFLRTKDRYNPSGEISNGRFANGKKQLEDEITESKELTVANACHAKKPVDKFMKSEPLINSDSSVQLPLYRNSFPSASFPKHRKSVNLGIRDDDDNSFRRSRFNTKIRAFRPQPRNSYRRIRKMLTSKYRKMAPRLKEYDLLNTHGGLRPFYRSRKLIHPRDSYHCENPSKRRKICGRSFVVAYDREASSESISNSPEKGKKGEEFVSDTVLLRGNGVSTSGKVHKKPKDSKVKFSIKSFKVPELYIEVPETATVGSLKRTVMETVTAILGGGLRVGVVLQGKKVRDDNRTLQQAGISHGGNLDTLGFVLEPNLATSPKASPHSFQRESEWKFSRSPACPNLDSGLSDEAFAPAPKTTTINQHDSDKEIVPSSVSPADSLIDEAMADSKALVHVPEINAEPLAALPMNPKTKRCEASHRRTRRPFSVGEVEALVEAVETLGTGRWRDVKMRAFDNADHRTYVDLKDKWKTLVHTASISPQQRRGEPVPQDLLDRVLAAHAYWSQQHLSKQHGKHQVEPIKIMDAQGKAIDV